MALEGRFGQFADVRRDLAKKMGGYFWEGVESGILTTGPSLHYFSKKTGACGYLWLQQLFLCHTAANLVVKPLYF